MKISYLIKILADVNCNYLSYTESPRDDGSYITHIVAEKEANVVGDFKVIDFTFECTDNDNHLVEAWSLKYLSLELYASHLCDDMLNGSDIVSFKVVTTNFENELD